MNKAYLPSRRLIIIASILVGLLALAIGIDFLNKSGFKLARQDKSSLTSPTIGDVVARDSDKDGVADWFEDLWGFDSTNPDTLGTGRGDLVEIENRRQQLASGDTTDIDPLSQQLLSTILSLDSVGGINDNTIQSISEGLSDAVVGEDISDPYTEKQLRTVPDSTTSNRTYYNQMVSVRKTYIQKGIGTELDVIQENIDKSSDSGDDMERIAALYQEYAQQMMTLSVPNGLVSLHLAAANTHYKVGSAVRDIGQLNSDSKRAVGGMARYGAYINFLGEINIQFEAYFKKYGIL